MCSSPSFQEFDFHVRWPGVKLLTSLLKQQGPQVQQIILVSPMGKCSNPLLVHLKRDAQQTWQRPRGASRRWCKELQHEKAAPFHVFF